jgi:aminopeptidase N
MTYNKPAIVYRMLRELVGEPAFRRGLRLYYERNRLRHVREADFRAALEEASGRDLGWFFEQWIHTTGTLDWSVGAVSTRALADGRFETSIEVLRAGDIWMPVHLRVGEAERRVEGRERRQMVTVTTAARPAEAVLDPDDVLLDIDPTNNRKAIGP